MQFSSALLVLLGLAASSRAQIDLRDPRGVIVESVVNGRKHCTVWPRRCDRDDTPLILKAFAQCNNGGTVVFPERAKYYIGTRMNPIVNDVHIEWRGKWLMSPNVTYWRANVYPIAFQNHAAGIVFSGSGLTIDGYDTGHIDGNGDAWYGLEQGKTQVGRPMPFVFWNITDVDVQNFKVLQPPLWAINIMNGTNMNFNNILVNATSHDAPPNTIWTGNTDGFDTMDARNITLTNFVYRGGDDCVAIKPRSYNVFVKNVTCVGGNGVAIGSLGQYLEDNSVQDVVFDDVYVIRDLQNLRDSAYIKTWMGGLVPQDSYESGGVPRGGGWGIVKNITFRNFRLHGPNHGPTITQNAGKGSYEEYRGTSKIAVSDVLFEDWTGFLAGETRMATFECSGVHKCDNIVVKNVNLLSWSQGDPVYSGRCENVTVGGIIGVEGESCNPMA